MAIVSHNWRMRKATWYASTNVEALEARTLFAVDVSYDDFRSSDGLILAGDASISPSGGSVFLTRAIENPPDPLEDPSVGSVVAKLDVSRWSASIRWSFRWSLSGVTEQVPGSLEVSLFGTTIDFGSAFIQTTWSDASYLPEGQSFQDGRIWNVWVDMSPVRDQRYPSIAIEIRASAQNSRPVTAVWSGSVGTIYPLHTPGDIKFSASAFPSEQRFELLALHARDSFDPDDHVEGSLPLQPSFNLGERWTATGSIDSAQGYSADVDLYRLWPATRYPVGGDYFQFHVKGSQPGSGVTPLLRIFDDFGNELVDRISHMESNSATSRGTWFTVFFPYAYLRSSFYIGVSSSANRSYGIWTGTGDDPAALSAGGGYVLQITRLTGRSAIYAHRGEVQRPANLDGRTNLEFIEPFLVRQGGAPIERALPTWVLVHGRSDSSASFRTNGDATARDLAAARGRNEQVLLLDWRQGARDNRGVTGALQGSRWIVSLAEWTSRILVGLGISPDRLHFVGHSWGTYVAYQTAAELARIRGIDKSVQSIVALDPANGGRAARLAGAWVPPGLDFSRYAVMSWAIGGGGLYGSRSFAKTATERYSLRYRPLPESSQSEDWYHAAPRTVFGSIVRANRVASNSSLAGLFALTRLIRGDQLTIPKRTFRGFDAIFVVGPLPLTSSGLQEFRYRAADGREATINLVPSR